MKTRPTFRPQVEALEGRAVPAAGAAQPLAGGVSGTWTTEMTIPDTGGARRLTGFGTVVPLGDVAATGTVRTPGFIARGHTTVTVTLQDAAGSVTVRLVSVATQPGFGPPAALYKYTITGATGAFAGLAGHGTATLREVEAAGPPTAPPGGAAPLVIVGPLFTLHFGTAAA
jgi:hypothetical protein